MASLFLSLSSLPLKTNPALISFHPRHPFALTTNLSFSLPLKHPSRKQTRFSAKDEEEREPISSSSSSSSTVTLVSEENAHEKPNEKPTEIDGNEEGESDEETQKQEVDWKADEEFKKFMGNPSIEAAIKLEKKRADRKLKELDIETGSNPVTGVFKRVIRDSLSREKERLEKAEEAFKALDLNKVGNFHLGFGSSSFVGIHMLFFEFC